MSHVCYDYLTESLLFSGAAENNFADISEEELRKQLDQYRSYVLEHRQEINEEILSSQFKVSVVLDSFQKLPDENLLKQLSLYIDCIMVSDPIFELTETASTSTKVMSQFYGMDREDSIDREKLSNAVIYMKKVALLIACDFIKFIPSSFLHEAPKEIPIRFDPNGFRDALPSQLMEYLRNKIDVRNIGERGRIYLDEPLQIGTVIYLYFPELLDTYNGEAVAYQKVVPVETGNDGSFKIRIEKATSISKSEFAAWVEQSKNTACLQLCKEMTADILNACELKAMYMTSSPFKASILSKDVQNESNKSKIANLSLNIDLPVFDGVPIDTIVDIRTKYGESFSNFRTELGQKLVGLNTADEDNLRNELNSISYEINETCVNNINKEVRSFRRHLGVDATIVLGSLISNYFTGGMTLLGATLAIADGLKEYASNGADLRKQPGYFLWKIDKSRKHKEI